jgi:chromosome segregation ATPase
VFYQLQTSYHLYFFIHMSSGDGPMDVSQEHVPQLQTEVATQRAHIQLLTERLAGSEARGEHASDLRLHAADLRTQVEATKAAADSALHELRLQHTREAELLQRVVEGMHAQLRDKEKVIQSKDEVVAQLVRQLADKDKQLPALLQAAVGDIQAEATALRATQAAKEKAVSDMQTELRALRAERDTAVAAVCEREAQVAALTATAADRTIEGRRAGPVAGSVVSVDNFLAGARVRSSAHFGGPSGALVSIADNTVTARWDYGSEAQIVIPTLSLRYE